MAMSDAEIKRLALAEYWDDRYANVGPDQQVHEWFRSFKDLELFFARHLFQLRAPETAPRILHLGSGDSSSKIPSASKTIPQDLSKRGYKTQLCVDFSSVVVQTMSKRCADTEGVSWEQADVRQMDQLPSESVDIAFDKGTLDVMIHGSPWDPPDKVLDDTGRYIREVYRVLKPDGTFLYVTYRQPHFIKPLIGLEDLNWKIEIEQLGDTDSSLGYYGFILKKRRDTVGEAVKERKDWEMG